MKKIILAFFLIPSFGFGETINFAVGVIPDTQSFFFNFEKDNDQAHLFPPACVSSDPAIIKSMYNWISSKNRQLSDTYPNTLISDEYANDFKYIFHVGDLVERGGGYNSDPNMNCNDQITHEEWNKATQIFKQIIKDDLADSDIGYGFAVGNHDFVSPQNCPGNGVYGNDAQIKDAKEFLQTMYALKDGNSSYVITDNPFIAYKKVTIEDSEANPVLSLIMLNLPWQLESKPEQVSAVENFIDKNAKSLFIVNSHYLGSGPISDMLKRKKNVLIAVWGHVTTTIPKQQVNLQSFPAVAPMTYRDGETPAYGYQLDYQMTYKDNPCTNASNMPQFPIFQILNFSIDTQTQTLSWNVMYVLAWNKNLINSNGNPVYNGDRVKYYPNGVPSASQMWYPFKDHNPTVKYNKYFN